MLNDSLQNLRVLDLSHVVAGPVCGMLLGDMGAHVVKVESPDGELGRRIGPPYLHGESVVSLSVNRNKWGLAIDLKTSEGRRTLLDMASQADVLIESFRPGVMKRLGLDYDTVRAVNPRLVYTSISAFGQTGPWCDRAGVDGVVQAVAGLMNTVGQAGCNPMKMTIPVTDMVTGYLATIGVLGALHRVRRDGMGQHLDVSLYNATLMLQQVGLSFFLATGEEPEKTGSAAPYAAPNEAFPTADGWIMVAAYQPDRWQALCQALELPTLQADPRFADNTGRVRHRSPLYQLLAERFQRRTTAAWAAQLHAVDILCAPIASYREVTESEQYRHAAVETRVQHPVAGEVRMPGFALGQGSGTVQPNPPPRIGEHSAQVLSAYGLADADIQRLLQSGVVRSLNDASSSARV